MILEKLINLANELDKKGLTKEADQIDEILKTADFSDWLKPKKFECRCFCIICQNANKLLKNVGTVGFNTQKEKAQNEHNKCTCENCPCELKQE